MIVQQVGWVEHSETQQWFWTPVFPGMPTRYQIVNDLC